MNNADTERAARLNRERLAYRYSSALETGDFASLAAVLSEAETDPALARIIDEINAACAAELDLAQRAEDEQIVRDLLAAHFLSSQGAPADPPPLTVGAVIAAMWERIERYGQGGADARRLAGLLRESEHLLPERFSHREVQQLFERLGVNADDHFRKLFRDTAITLALGRARQAQLAAARKQRPLRRTREEDAP